MQVRAGLRRVGDGGEGARSPLGGHLGGRRASLRSTGWAAARFLSAAGSAPVAPRVAPRSPHRFLATPQRGPAAPARPPPHMARPREPRARCVYVRRRAGAGWLGGRVTRHYIMGAEAAAAGGDT